MKTSDELALEQKEILRSAFRKALKVTQNSASHGVYLRNSKPEIHPDSKVSLKINGKEILTTGAELEKVLKDQMEQDWYFKMVKIILNE